MTPYYILIGLALTGAASVVVLFWINLTLRRHIDQLRRELQHPGRPWQ